MTLDTKLTMALAGCSGSCSANRWHTLSVALPCFRATNPKTLQRTVGSACQFPTCKARVGTQSPASSCHLCLLGPSCPSGHLPASSAPSPFCGRMLMLQLCTGEGRPSWSGTRGVTAASPARGLWTLVRVNCQAHSPVSLGRTQLPLGVRLLPPPHRAASPKASCACVTTTHS